MLKHFVQGVKVNDEELALDIIKNVGPGGHFLDTEHTASKFRTIWYPQLFSRKMKNENFSEIRGKIHTTIHSVIAHHQVPSLAPEILKELEKWEEKLTN